jgi:ABC-2 type transport system ATP-binding protein
MSENVIEVNGLLKKFGSFTAVNKIDLHVKKGEIFGFLGANGAGKSTTIKMLCGLLTPDGGKATVAGFDVAEKPEDVKRNIGYMCQKYAMYEDLTASENLDYYGTIYGLSKKYLKERKGEVFELLGLQDVKDIQTGALPRGYQQRIAFAGAVLHKPSIIFLDEPTAGVDPLQRRNFWDMIYDFSASGTTVFVTTHFLDEAEFCHRISFIVSSNIVAEGTPGELKAMDLGIEKEEPDLEDVFIALSTGGIK